MNLSLLVHTFNGYEFCWDGCLESYKKHFWSDIPLYWGTNTPNHDKHDFGQFKVIYSGIGEWSDRLLVLLDQINTDYVLYMQEDFWLTDEPPSLQFLMTLVEKHCLLRLQISPIVQFYSLYGSNWPFFFYEHAKSKYLVNHQPAIWSKKFLISCLEKGENPWQNEYRGTCRLWTQPEKIKGKLAIFPHNWFKHMVSNGKFADS